MAKIQFVVAIFLIFMFIQLEACNNFDDNRKPPVFKQIPELAEIKPQKPVKIKLKRNASGKYTWELNGDNADTIIQVNKKLRNSLESDSISK